MSMRYPGGLIATSPVNARYPSGVWTQAQAAPYQAQNVWTRDQFWPYTTLLLQGDGAVNGAQNNTFLDSSSNNFTITRNGNTTQGSFTPYEQDGYWSNFFDGSGDNLTTPSNAALAFGSSDFTIEAWVNPSSKVKAYPSIFGNTVGFGSNYVSLQFDHDSAARKFRFWVYNANSGSPLLESPAAYSYSNWYHVAVTRSGSTFRMFIDGTLVVSATYSGAVDGGSSQVARIGGNATSDDDFAGTVSNFRIVKGTALYTANFTPPAAPLTAITNTSLLTCQSNRFKDNSTNNFTLTVNGNTSVQSFQPFPGATTWSASVLGGSGYFDGSGDYLSGIGATDSFNFMHNSTALFTFECWLFLPSVAAAQTLIDNTNGTSSQIGISLSITAGGNLEIFITRGVTGVGNVTAYITSTGVVPTNQWAHIAITYNQSLASNNGNFYINGASAGSGNKTGNTPSSSNASNAMRIGTFGAGAGNFVNGYISNLRISNSIVYSSAFTPPTAPVTGGALLTNFTNAGIYDNSMMNNLETVGNAQVSTSVVKYGTGSMFFDGSTGNLVAPYNPNYSLGTGDFTIEGWFYFTNLSTNQRGLVALGDGANGSGPIYNAWSLTYQGSEGSNQLRFYRYDGTEYQYLTSGLTLVENTWTHVAVSRGGGVLRIFVNGVPYYSAANSQSFAAVNTNPLRVALQYYGPASGYGGPRYWPGYIDDLRITKGAARYITNFTPPPARMPGQ